MSTECEKTDKERHDVADDDDDEVWRENEKERKRGEEDGKREKRKGEKRKRESAPPPQRVPGSIMRARVDRRDTSEAGRYWTGEGDEVNSRHIRR